MKTSGKPKWFLQKLKELGSTGKLDLSGEVLDNLSIVGSRKSMKVLDLSFTSITSLEGLADQPKLEHLILDGSLVESFKNAASISNITKLNLRNTPVSKLPNYRISLFLVCGGNIRIIDGKIIPDAIKRKAETYPPIAAKLVNSGWMAEYPCPTEEEIKELCVQYGVNYEQSQSEALNEIPLFEEKDIDEVIKKYSTRHKDMLRRAQEKLENCEDVNSVSVTATESSVNIEKTEEFTFPEEGTRLSASEEESFLDFDPNLLSYRVSEIIKKYGFDIEDGDAVSSIIASLTHIFGVAEGQDIDFPQVLMDANAVVTDESSEEESITSDDFAEMTNRYSANKTSGNADGKQTAGKQVVFEEVIPESEYPKMVQPNSAPKGILKPALKIKNNEEEDYDYRGNEEESAYDQLAGEEQPQRAEKHGTDEVVIIQEIEEEEEEGILSANNEEEEIIGLNPNAGDAERNGEEEEEEEVTELSINNIDELALDNINEEEDIFNFSNENTEEAVGGEEEELTISNENIDNNLQENIMEEEEEDLSQETKEIINSNTGDDNDNNNNEPDGFLDENDDEEINEHSIEDTNTSYNNTLSSEQIPENMILEDSYDQFNEEEDLNESQNLLSNEEPILNEGDDIGSEDIPDDE